MKLYVCGFMVAEFAGREYVLLAQKARPEWQRGRFNGLGGHVNPGELPGAAMVREFEEESGITTDGTDWQPVVTMTGRDFVIWFYVSRAVNFGADGGYPVCVGKPDEPVSWRPVANLPAEVVPNLRWLLPLALDPAVRKPVPIDDLGQFTQPLHRDPACHPSQPVAGYNSVWPDLRPRKPAQDDAGGPNAGSS